MKFGEEERGKYGRLLAYVYRAPDGLFVNLELVRQGYGKAYTKYPFEYMSLFQQYEKVAQTVKKGLWGVPTDNSKSVGKIGKADLKSEDTVYVTKSGKKYHLESCRWGNIPISLNEAKQSYLPCRVCKP